MYTNRCTHHVPLRASLFVCRGWTASLVGCCDQVCLTLLGQVVEPLAVFHHTFHRQLLRTAPGSLSARAWPYQHPPDTCCVHAIVSILCEMAGFSCSKQQGHKIQVQVPLCWRWTRDTGL